MAWSHISGQIYRILPLCYCIPCMFYKATSRTGAMDLGSPFFVVYSYSETNHRREGKIKFSLNLKDALSDIVENL